MDKEKPNLINIKNEVFSEGYFERARQRAKRRKSPWNLLLIPLAFIGIGGISYGLFRFMWMVHTWFYPNHIGKLREFWVEGAGGYTFVSSFLLLVPLFFAAIPLGLMAANVITCFIAPARRAFDREAKGVKWASFPEAMKSLMMPALVIVSICLLISFIGAVTLVHLR